MIRPNGVAVSFVLGGCGRPEEAKEYRLRYFISSNFHKMKRTILMLLYSFSTAMALGQCAQYVDTTTDKFNGTKTIASKDFIPIGAGTESVKLLLATSDRFPTQLSFVFILPMKTCVNEKDEVTFLFKDKTTITGKTQSKFNCNSKFTLYTGGIFKNTDLIEKLKTSKLDAIRFVTMGNVHDFTTTDQQSILIANTINCIGNNVN